MTLIEIGKFCHSHFFFPLSGFSKELRFKFLQKVSYGGPTLLAAFESQLRIVQTGGVTLMHFHFSMVERGIKHVQDSKPGTPSIYGSQPKSSLGFSI